MRKKLEQALYRSYPGIGFSIVWFGVPLLVLQVLGLGGWASFLAFPIGVVGMLLVHRGIFNQERSLHAQEADDAAV